MAGVSRLTMWGGKDGKDKAQKPGYNVTITGLGSVKPPGSKVPTCPPAAALPHLPLNRSAEDEVDPERPRETLPVAVTTCRQRRRPISPTTPTDPSRIGRLGEPWLNASANVQEKDKGKGMGKEAKRDSEWKRDRERDSEWTCSSCSTSCFDSKSHCYKCKAPKPSGGKASGKVPTRLPLLPPASPCMGHIRSTAARLGAGTEGGDD